jgi:succinate-semialdehyde dehydrogenase/glutarate-semialdehyde dehydrogenase
MGFAAAAERTSATDRIVSINPATGVPLGDVPDTGADGVRAAVARARAAQKEWARLSLEERCRKVRRYSVELMARADQVIDLICKEGGKTRSEALGTEVAVVADLANYFAKHAPRLLAPEPIPLHLLRHRKSYVHYVPRGVVGIVAPWNFPFSIPMGEVIMSAIAGNGVVLKPSEFTPLIALEAKKIWEAAALPADLFQVVTGRGATGAALIDAGIDYCVFTGSVATGRKVAAACGERLIPCTLELGGKAPAIVCADADLERTAQALVWGGFCNSGQVCCSVERVYAHASVHDELVRRVVEQTRSLRQGDPTGSAEVDVGAMTWERQVDTVDDLVRQAVGAGAHVETGGRRQPGAGLFYEPTVLSNCRQDMDVMRREIFGPVLPIMKVTSEAEAVELANDSHLGLLAYVFTRDRDKGRRLAEQIEAGTVMINDVLNTFGCPETPWGGVKMSGIGRTHSVIGLRDLCELRHVNVDRISLRKELWWYPYSSRKYRGMLAVMKKVLGSRRFSLT